MIDIEVVVDKLDQLGLIRKHRITGDYYTIYCPFHNGGQERRPSAGILLHDQYRNGNHYSAGFFHCFTCSSANTLTQFVTELLKQKNIGKSGLDWLKENIPGFEETEVEFEYLIPQDDADTLTSKYAVESLKQLIAAQNKEYIPESELKNYRYECAYMYQRGLTSEIIEKYDIGVDMNFVPPGRTKSLPCITFPVRDSTGKTTMVLRRSIEGKQFYIPKGVDKPLYGLYELPNGCRSVDLVESCFNALTCVKYGRPAIALLGTGTTSQIQQLRRLGIEEFRLGFDPDEAGERATEKFKKALKDVAIVWRYEGIPAGKDINDLSETEFNDLDLV